jgi:hypothetical protein
MAGGSDNGWSDSGSSDDLPDLPEEWGVIVIPDDLSELSDEVASVRAELKLAEHPTRWRRLLSRPGVRRLRRVGIAALRAPVLIISMAVLVTVASLVASAWPGPPRQPAVQRSSDNEDSLDTLPALDLLDDHNHSASLRGRLPAVVLITDGCPCDSLIAATIAAAKNRSQVAVVVVEAAPSASAAPSQTSANQTSATQSPATQSPATQSPATQTPATQTTPKAQTPGQPVVLLHAQPNNNVREQLKLGVPDGTAAAFVVNRNGEVVGEVRRTVLVDDIQPYLAKI